MGCGSSSEDQPVSTITNVRSTFQLREIPIDKDLLLNFVDLENRINEFEGRGVASNLQFKYRELKTLESELAKTEDELKKLTEQSKQKPPGGLTKRASVQQFFENVDTQKEQLSKDEENQVESINRTEILKKEVETQGLKIQSLRSMVAAFRRDAEELQALYRQQEEILDVMFGGKYGSVREYELEAEYDIAAEEWQRMKATKQRWEAAKTVAQHGSHQLFHAAHAWYRIARVQQHSYQQRYATATEVRNHLMAAVQNLTNGQQYVAPTQFPYCNASEIETLKRATAHLYIDMQSDVGHANSQRVYNVSAQRSAALVQWITMVLDNNIVRDLVNTGKLMFERKKLLRMERVRLIQERLIEMFGPEQANSMVDLDPDANLSDAAELDVHLGEAFLPDGTITHKDSQMSVENIPEPQPTPADTAADDGDTAAPAAPAAVAAADLPPPPSQADLFGNIDELRRKHDEDMADLQHAQEVDRARMEQGLEAKLAARRSRRLRMEAQDTEMAQLMDATATVQPVQPPSA